MPAWIEKRKDHILSKNPEMPESMAWGLATQQSHALGKTPRGYGTAEGRAKAKAKYTHPSTMKKTAFVEAIPALTGLASGYGPGRRVAGHVAAEVAPEGRKTRSEELARDAAIVGAPIGGLTGMALAKKYNLAPRIADLAARHFPGGLIAEPAAERELINVGAPGVAAILGSLGGGATTGGVLGSIQRLRGPLRGAPEPPPIEKASSTGWGQTLTPLMAGLGFDAFLKRADKKDPIKTEPEDAATGDENDPMTDKLAFNTNQYSGVMNPPPMVYRSGIPAFQSPPVQTTAGPTGEAPGEAAQKNAALFAPPAEHEAAQAVGGALHLPPALIGVADDALIVGRRFLGGHKQENPEAPPPPKLAAAGLTPLSRLNSSRLVGAPKMTPPPGPSIAQIAKPKGYGTPISGAAKGNHLI